MSLSTALKWAVNGLHLVEIENEDKLTCLKNSVFVFLSDVVRMEQVFIQMCGTADI